MIKGAKALEAAMIFCSHTVPTTELWFHEPFEAIEALGLYEAPTRLEIPGAEASHQLVPVRFQWFQFAANPLL